MFVTKGESSGESKVDIKISLPTLTLQMPQRCGSNSEGNVICVFGWCAWLHDCFRKALFLGCLKGQFGITCNI